MKGLLYKDILCLMRQLKLLFWMVILFTIIPNYNVRSFALVYSICMPFTALALDERSHWNRLAAMLPYSDLQLVLSKYMLGWILMVGLSLVGVAGQGIYCLIARTGFDMEGLYSTIMLLSASTLMTAFMLPLMFRFGTEKARLILILAVIAGCILGMTGTSITNPAYNKALSGAKVSLVFLGAAVAGNIVSLLISVRLFRKGLRT